MVWHSEGAERDEKRRLHLDDIREVTERMNKIIKERDAKEKMPAAATSTQYRTSSEGGWKFHKLTRRVT